MPFACVDAVRPFGLREVEAMRDLDPSHIDQLLTIKVLSLA